jgi:hypothetical protein
MGRITMRVCRRAQGLPPLVGVIKAHAYQKRGQQQQHKDCPQPHVRDSTLVFRDCPRVKLEVWITYDNHNSEGKLMAKWIRLTHHAGGTIWVNLDVASHIIRYDGYDTTNIEVPTGQGFQGIIVKETPTEIWAATNQKWG